MEVYSAAYASCDLLNLHTIPTPVPDRYALPPRWVQPEATTYSLVIPKRDEDDFGHEKFQELKTAVPPTTRIMLPRFIETPSAAVYKYTALQSNAFYNYYAQRESGNLRISPSNYLLLAAGHANKFFAYPDEYGRQIYVLKVTALREVQFYRVLHALAKCPIVSYDTLMPLIGSGFQQSMKNASEFLSYLETSFRASNHYSSSKNLKELVYPTMSGIKNLRSICGDDADAVQELKKLQSYQYAAEKLLNCVPICRETFAHSPGGKDHMDFGVIKMVNLTFNMQQSLVLDIKMGRRLYGDEASKEKKERAIKKAMNRSIGTLGFSFCGMIGYNYNGVKLQVHGGSRSTSDSIEENPLTVEQYADFVFSKYLSAMRTPALAVTIGQLLIRKIEKIVKVLKKQTLVAFYGSSLLFVIDTLVKEEKDITSKSVVVKMIDFANVTLFTSHRDEDYLFGLHNLLHALRMAVSKLEKNIKE